MQETSRNILLCSNAHLRLRIKIACLSFEGDTELNIYTAETKKDRQPAVFFS